MSDYKRSVSYTHLDVYKRQVRGFTGFAGRSGIPEIEDSEIVYVTDHGTVYHRDLGCRHLKLSVQQTELDKVEELSLIHILFFRTGVCLIKFKALQAAADGRAVILTINSDNSLSHPGAEKTSRCASFRKRGSLTVEAALVFPLFLFALTAFLSLFFLVQVRVEIGRALTDTGRELAQMAYFSEDAGSLAPSAMAMLYGRCV